LLYGALNSRSSGPGFGSHPPRCQVRRCPNTCVTKQHNLVPAVWCWCSETRKVIVGLAPHMPCVTDFAVYWLKGLRRENKHARFWFYGLFHRTKCGVIRNGAGTCKHVVRIKIETCRRKWRRSFTFQGFGERCEPPKRRMGRTPSRN